MFSYYKLYCIPTAGNTTSISLKCCKTHGFNSPIVCLFGHKKHKEFSSAMISCSGWLMPASSKTYFLSSILRGKVHMKIMSSCFPNAARWWERRSFIALIPCWKTSAANTLIKVPRGMIHFSPTPSFLISLNLYFCMMTCFRYGQDDKRHLGILRIVAVNKICNHCNFVFITLFSQ